MSGALRFDGQVLIVTGAGHANGIGGACAIELARRGARVVVNNHHRGDGVPRAEAVATLIRQTGGEAIASTEPVSEAGGGQRLVAHALDTWGRIDGVIGAAGNMAPARFLDTPFESFAALLDVHLGGIVSVFQPAFRYMRDHGGGRLLIVGGASGTFGGVGHANYGAAKAAQIGLMHSIAAEGAPYAIQCNTLLPWAKGTELGAKVATSTIWTERPAMPSFEPGFIAELTPERVAAMATALVHSSCRATNQMYSAYGRHYGRLWLSANEGWIASDDAGAEDLLAHWQAIHGGPGEEQDGDTMDFGARSRDIRQRY